MTRAREPLRLLAYLARTVVLGVVLGAVLFGAYLLAAVFRN